MPPKKKKNDPKVIYDRQIIKSLPKIDKKVEGLGDVRSTGVKVSSISETTESQTVDHGIGNGNVHLLKLESDKQFHVINTIMLKEGPYKGCQAILIREEPKFPFLKLPAELRNMIYEYALRTRASMIHIYEPMPSDDDISSFEGIASAGYRAKNRTAILATCRQVYQEALPILYTHSFEFEYANLASDFLLRVGKGVEYVKSIEIIEYADRHLKALFHFLALATNLEHLVLGIDWWDIAVAELIYKEGKQWFKVLGDAGKVPKIRFSALARSEDDRHAFFSRLNELVKSNKSVSASIEEGSEIIED